MTSSQRSARERSFEKKGGRRKKKEKERKKKKKKKKKERKGKERKEGHLSTRKILLQGLQIFAFSDNELANVKAIIQEGVQNSIKLESLKLGPAFELCHFKITP